jgi:hypothetical protein
MPPVRQVEQPPNAFNRLELIFLATHGRVQSPFQRRRRRRSRRRRVEAHRQRSAAVRLADADTCMFPNRANTSDN